MTLAQLVRVSTEDVWCTLIALIALITLIIPSTHLVFGLTGGGLDTRRNTDTEYVFM